MTPDELKRIANAPGYGTGKAARDRMAAEAECRSLLPDPRTVACVEARGDEGGHLVPVCNFGWSSDTKSDWGLYHHGTDDLSGALGHDARDDAQIIAAIVNAYRLGILVVKEPSQ